MSITVSVVDKWITTKDKNELFTKTWKPVSTPIAYLVMVHGFGEHVSRYDRLFTYFASQGIECYGYDQRGWGETAKKSNQFGNNQGYQTALKDIDEAILSIKRPKDTPLFLMGHSMGGGLILNYLARGDTFKGVQLVNGAIASAALVKLAMPISAFKYYSLRFISNITPSFTIHAGINTSGLTHDEEEVKKYLNDPLIHDFVTLSTIKGFIHAGKDILKSKAKSITTPILYSHADTDPINSYQGAVEAFKLTSSKDKELKNWPGLLHELHNEEMPQRQQVAEFYVDWIKKHCNIKH